MTWNYRIVKVKDGYGLYEVYYNEKGKPYTRTERPFAWGDSPEEVLSDLRRMIEDATRQTVLDDMGIEEWEGDNE